MMKKIICFVLFCFGCSVSVFAQDLLPNVTSCNEMVNAANEVYQQIQKIKDSYTQTMNEELDAANNSYQRKLTAISREVQESPSDFEQRRRSEKAELLAVLTEDTNRIQQQYEALIAENTAELETKFQSCKNNNWSMASNRVKVTFLKYDPKTLRYYFTLTDEDDGGIYYEWYINVAAKDPQAQKELYQKISQYVRAKGYIGYMVYSIVWDENNLEFVKKLKSAGLKQKDINQVVSAVNVKTCFPKYGDGFVVTVAELPSLLSVLTASEQPYLIRIYDEKPNLPAIAAALNTKPAVKVNLDLSKCTDTDPVKDKPFSSCTNLEGVVTPLVINDGLFDECVSLKTITFTEGVTAIGEKSFFGCAGLTGVVLPETLKSIGNQAFDGCVGLTSMTLPESVTSVGEGAFIGCFGLTEPIYNSNVFAYLLPTFEGEYSIPNGIKEISGRAFYNCKGLTNVNIPKSVRNIGNNAFEKCEKLTKPVFNSYVFAYMPADFKGAYTIQRGIKIIAGGAFANCAELSAINLPNSLMTVGDGAFYGCNELTNVIIPNSALYICDDAFRNCDELLTVKIGLYVKSIGKGAFAECAKLLSVALPDSVSSIGDEVFYDCPNLRDVTIPNGVHHIGKMSFYKCVGMTNITIGNDVVSIGESAFSYCNSLPDVIVPNSVTTIENGAFSNCEKLKTLSVHAVEPTHIGTNLLDNCPSFTGIFVPIATLSEYKAAPNWSDYADKIFAGDF